MNARRPARGTLARWLGWALFWSGVYYAGVEVQTWAFSLDAAPESAAAAILGPLHFWFPAVLFFLPVWSAQRLFDSLPTEWMGAAVRVAVAAWAITVAGLIVRVEDELRPGATPRIGTWALVAVMVTLIALRLIALPAQHPFDGFGVDEISNMLLSGLVGATWISLLLGLVVIAVRRPRRRRSD